MGEMNDEIVDALTAVMREADRTFMVRVGGSTRHFVRDCLLPLMAQNGLTVSRTPHAAADGAVVEAAQRVLDAFENYPFCSLALEALRAAIQSRTAPSGDDHG